MKKIIALVTVLVIILFSCQRDITNTTKQQNFPDDHELFNTERDNNARRKPKPPRGGGNPTDTTTNPPIDTNGEVCIYLDHDGETLNNTLWNQYVNGATLTLSPSGMSDEQKALIRSRVAADYAIEKGFTKRIVVTDSYSVFLSYPITARAQVIITASHEWYPAAAGGVAYVGSYMWGDGTPCFVFSKAYNYDVNWISHASSHEPGHMFGLRHQSLYNDCVLVDTYRPGWIMGRFSTYPSIFGTGVTNVCCTCTQNDIAVVNSNL